MATNATNNEFTELYTAQTQLSNELADENRVLLNRERQTVPQRQAFVDQLLKKLDDLVKKHAENDAKLIELNAGGEFDGRSYFNKRHAEAFGEIVANMRKKCNKILERIARRTEAGAGVSAGDNVEALEEEEDSEDQDEEKVRSQLVFSKGTSSRIWLIFKRQPRFCRIRFQDSHYQDSLKCSHGNNRRWVTRGSLMERNINRCRSLKEV